MYVVSCVVIALLCVRGQVLYSLFQDLTLFERQFDKKHGRPLTRVISVPYTKVGEKGVPLRGQSRELVCRVRDYFQRDKINKGPILPVEKVIERTAGALEIGKNTVVRIGKEKIQSEQSGLKLNTPDKKYSRFEPVTELDAFQKEMPSTAMSKDSS
ncbi:hypothetical protein J6590_078666 [Homalodisca vitripennis]|nr:hypothetical protein J6590_078666 [Homalodisca vitripennis]